MNSKGFTLIELIVVIVILGILAATAAPKFINLKSDAQNATLQAVQASMHGAAALIYSKSLVKGNQKLGLSDSPFVTIESGALEIEYGYPRSQIAGWKRLLDIDLTAFTMSTLGDGSLAIYRIDRTGTLPFSIAADCIAYYKAPIGVGEKPTINVNPCS